MAKDSLPQGGNISSLKLPGYENEYSWWLPDLTLKNSRFRQQYIYFLRADLRKER